MPRHTQITCPHCQRSGLRIRTEFLGRSVLCKHCGKSFRSRPVDDPAGSHEAELALADGQAAELAHELEEARAQVDQLHDQLRLLREQSEAERELQRRDWAAHEDRAREKFQEELRASRLEHQALRTQYDGALRKIDALAAELDVRRDEADRLNLLFKAASEEQPDLARLGAEAKTAQSRLEEEVAGLRDQLEISRRERDDLATGLEIQRADAERLARKLDRERDEQERELDSLRREFEHARAAAEIGATRERLVARNGAAATAAPPHDDLRSRLDSLREELRQALEANHRLSSLLNVFGVTKESTTPTA